MNLLLIGIVVFFGVHCVSIVAPAWRDRMVARLGEGAWKGLYSLLSIAGFVLMIRGYSLARLEPMTFYNSPFWLRYVAAILMLPVFPLLLATYFPGRIKTTMKHPMLNAIKFWALAHLLVNGTLADILLFGSFLAWAVADRISMKHRPQRPVPSMPAFALNDAIALVGGLSIYVAFLQWLHVSWIGVAPFP